MKYFYEDGSLASEDGVENGTMLWRTTFRPKGETSREHLYADVASDVVEMHFTYTSDGWTTSQTLFNTKREILAPDGTVAPPRHPSIPERVTFFVHEQRKSQTITESSGDTVASAMFIPAGGAGVTRIPRWESAEWRLENGQQIYRGLATHYEVDGTIAALNYTVDKTSELTHDTAKGDPLVDAAINDDASAITLLIDRGAHLGEASSLHAALAECHELAVQLSKRPPTVAPLWRGKVPKRPTGCPADAVWIPALKRYARANVVDGRIAGDASLWDKHGNPATWTYVDGKRVRSERVEDDERVIEEYDANGKLRLSRRIAGDLIDETEHASDGRTINRLSNAKAGWRAERVEADGALVSEEWWRGDTSVGTVEAIDNEELERFSGRTADGKEVTGLLTPGIGGQPHSAWMVGKAPVSALETLAAAKFISFSKAELSTFAAEIASWSNTPPKLIADIVAIDWRGRKSFFTRDPDLFPVLVRGLACGNADLALKCFNQVSNDVLHEATVSQVTGPMLSALLRIIGAFDDERVETMLVFLGTVWSVCKNSLASIPASGHESVYAAYIAAVDMIAKTDRDDLRGIIDDIRVSDKQHVLARIRGAKTPLERWEAVFESNEHPQLVPADFVETYEDADMLTRTMSAVSALLRFGKDAPRGAVDRLEEALKHYDTLAPQFAESRMADVPLVCALARMIWLAHSTGHDTERPRKLLPAIAAMLPKVGDPQLPEFIANVLLLSFGDRAPPFAPAFMDALEIAARAYERGVDVSGMCGHFGLPTDGEAMNALLATLRASSKPESALHDFMNGRS